MPGFWLVSHNDNFPNDPVVRPILKKIEILKFQILDIDGSKIKFHKKIVAKISFRKVTQINILKNQVKIFLMQLSKHSAI